MPELIGLDFETYSAVDLSTHGLMRYAHDDSFRVLIASTARHSSNGSYIEETFDFVEDYIGAGSDLGRALAGHTIVAHNAMFEKTMLSRLGIDLPADQFIDSAVLARAVGAGGHLEAAAPQLLGTDKMDAGRNLIRLFCVPQKDQTSDSFDESLVDLHPDEWRMFREYCQLDATLSLRLANFAKTYITKDEDQYQALTMQMNETGWHVDIQLVEEMQHRYKDNQAVALADFQSRHDAEDLNLNSLKQLKQWCADRGVKANSFDEKHVAKLHKRLVDKLTSNVAIPAAKREGYEAVADLLHTKKVLGGSSLKKLQVILDTELDGRLYDQYLHCGAGQTLRTTGRSVQMQNLKRLTDTPVMEDLYHPATHWDNEKLAENLRQVFTATDPRGKLIVGDFKSVESRGLAWLAGEKQKLSDYRAGMDIYKVQAALQYGVPYAMVTKEQRTFGKVGELSCGYGAGPDAVVSFAEGMGVTLTPGEASKLVHDWRDANPHIVDFWAKLNDMLQLVAGRGGTMSTPLSDQFRAVMYEISLPESLEKLQPDGRSIEMLIESPSSGVMMRRFFHGCHQRGRNVVYYKPSGRKTGDLWVHDFIDPKTKQRRNYELYGGKIAGILTQSLCREIFFRVLRNVQSWADVTKQVEVVGQFHDEIVLDWKPGAAQLEQHMLGFKALMSDPGKLVSFPLEADIKADYRYTK